jgi:membrane-associated protein
MMTITEFLQQLNRLDDIIRWGGYGILCAIIFAETGLLVGFFLPGDSLLITAGLFAARGDLNIWILFILLALMAIAGDSVSYWIGKTTGPKIFTREDSRFFSKKHIQHAPAFYDRYGGKTIILARFLPSRRLWPVWAKCTIRHLSSLMLWAAFYGLDPC